MTSQYGMLNKPKLGLPAGLPLLPLWKSHRLYPFQSQTGVDSQLKGKDHARNVDDSVSLGGVTVDMVNMRSIQVLEGGSKARVGSGHVLLFLYSGLAKCELGFSGGRVVDVELGGDRVSNRGPQYELMLDDIFEYVVSRDSMVLISSGQMFIDGCA